VSPAAPTSGGADPALAESAVALAAELLALSRRHQTRRQRREAARAARMLDDPAGRALAFDLADRLFRPLTPGQAADQFTRLLREHGMPRFPAGLERGLLGVAARLALRAPSLIMPMVIDHLRRQSASLILPAAPERLHAYLQSRRAAGFSSTVTLLGEAVLGEEEAASRLAGVLDLLAQPLLASVAVTLRCLCPQLDELAFDHSAGLSAERFRAVLRAARTHASTAPDGTRWPKSVILEIDESRDLEITAAVFRRVLEEDEFHELDAGITLPAYLPAAADLQISLTGWARERRAAGGGRIKLRLVKGANLALETIHAAEHGWPPAPFTARAETDAQFKRMLHLALDPAHTAAAWVCVSTHNLFDLSYALTLARRRGVANAVEFELHEGIANHHAAALHKLADRVSLFAPVVQRHDFGAAVAWLTRRLAEMSAPGGFLRDSYELTAGGPAWERQRGLFLAAFAAAGQPAPPHPARTDRTSAAGRLPACDAQGPFTAEPATDWSIPANRGWLADALLATRESPPQRIPCGIPGLPPDRDFPATGHDPSKPGQVAYSHALASEEALERALATACAARPGWNAVALPGRRALLTRAAAALAEARGSLLAALVLDAGLAAREADAEVAAAIDFAHFHARAFDDRSVFGDVEPDPLGIVVVAPPRGSPLAIPASTICAALMAGNTVVFKPSPSLVLAGHALAEILWQAGIPRDVLQFLPCGDNQVARNLVRDPRVDMVALAGSRETTRLYQRLRAGLALEAVAGGKVSVLITANADPEQAAADLARAAFTRAGQHCSAVSLAILEAAVYDSPAFRRQLRDAAAALPAAAAWDPAAVVTPLTRAPGKNLQRALTILEPGEEWLLKPTQVAGNPFLWSPGIRLGVQPGSWFHQTECFGPVLGLIRAADAAEGLRIQADGSAPLAAALFSLDRREMAGWCAAIEAPSLFINRPPQDVRPPSQPGGAWDQAATGTGFLAGGPNHIASFCHWVQTEIPPHQAELAPEVLDLLATMKRWMKKDEDRLVVEAAARSYRHFWESEFSVEHVRTLPGETRVFRYLRLPRGVLLRMGEPLDLPCLAGAVLAALTTGTRLELSLSRNSAFADALGVATSIETNDQLARRLATGADRFDRLRVTQPIPPDVSEAARTIHLPVIYRQIVANGRLELPNFLREQSITRAIHRHGIVTEPVAAAARSKA
jgi:RHH-type transcriptional regulator, proline utilization regulon repressor / proline dehydrogenase / delta 1-pyrroline-5-carboxylate dehydrogenase